MHKVAAILLAAGRSRRMGAFKPLLPFGNQTVIESSINYLREGGIETIVVVVGHRADEVQQQLSGKKLIFAVNPDPSSEMGASIATAVRVMPESMRATLVALVDQPAIPSSVVTCLVQTWSQGSKLVVPTWQNRGGHPVLVDLHFRQQLCQLGPRRGLKALFEDNPREVVRMPVDSPYIARDMDTWDDYRRLHEEVFGVPPTAAKN